MLQGKVKYFEIGPKISESIAVFKGDTPFKVNNLMHFDKGHNLSLNSIQTTVHLGAHADSPVHYKKDGPGIDQRSPLIYMGKAQVIEVSGKNKNERITKEDISNIKIKAPRILFKTKSFKDPNIWQEEFNSLSADLIKYLAKNNVQLVGIDTPSVDPADDKYLETHNEIAKNDFAILEGLTLDQVDNGIYYLLAIPLMLEGLDASPVRPLLFTEENWKKLLTL